MDPTAQHPVSSAGDHPSMSSRHERRCERFAAGGGGLDRERSQGGELVAYQADLDVRPNDALARLLLDSSVRVEVRRA